MWVFGNPNLHHQIYVVHVNSNISFDLTLAQTGNVTREEFYHNSSYLISTWSQYNVSTVNATFLPYVLVNSSSISFVNISLTDSGEYKIASGNVSFEFSLWVVVHPDSDLKIRRYVYIFLAIVLLLDLLVIVFVYRHYSRKRKEKYDVAKTHYCGKRVKFQQPYL